jgi:transposase
VAEVYRDAWARGEPPTRGVADHFTISKSAAAKQVAKAREMGLLPPTSRGKSSGIDTGDGS